MKGKIDDKKLIFCIISTIALMVILSYELFFCNSDFLMGRADSYNFSIYRIVVYILLIAMAIVFRKKIFKLIECGLDNKLIYIITIGVLCLVITLTIVALLRGDMTSDLAVIFIGLLLLALCISCMTSDYRKNTVVIILLLGFIFSLITPINNQLDEKRHFLAAFNLSYGNFDVLNNPITNEEMHNIESKQDFADFNKYFAVKYNEEQTNIFTTDDIKETPANYNPIQYLPSAIGIFTARILGGSVADIYYAGRIFNLLIYAVLVYIAIRHITIQKETIFCNIFNANAFMFSKCIFNRWNINGNYLNIYSILFKTL